MMVNPLSRLIQFNLFIIGKVTKFFISVLVPLKMMILVKIRTAQRRKKKRMEKVKARVRQEQCHIMKMKKRMEN